MGKKGNVSDPFGSFTDHGIQAIYDQFKTRLNAGERPTLADFTLLENTPTASPSEKTLLRKALANLNDIWGEVDRVATINDSQGKPASIPSSNIVALNLDYQIAVRSTRKNAQKSDPAANHAPWRQTA